MPNSNTQKRQQSTPTDSTVLPGTRGLLRLSSDVKRSCRKTAVCLFVVLGLFVCRSSGQTITLSSATGVAVTGPFPILPTAVYHTGFGAVNGLGVGTTPAGLQTAPAAGGQFFYTSYTISLFGVNNGNPGEVRAWVSTPFATSSSVLQLLSCPSPGPCTTFGSYQALPNAAPGLDVLPSTRNTGNYTAYLGIFVADTNGFATTANDSATINLDVLDKHGNINQTVQLKLDSPRTSVQTAVQLQLATAPSGLTINAGGSTDYTANFGTVNGLGIGPGAGLTVVSGQAPSGIIYATPYLLQPAFSGFSSANATKISVYVSTDFVHSTVLKLYDSQSKLTGYNAISKTSGAGATTITNAAVNGTPITEYLGLFVSNINGPTSFRGADSATLTYTITVQ